MDFRSFNNYCKIISFNSAETTAANHFNLGRMGNSGAFVRNGMYFRIKFFYVLEQGSRELLEQGLLEESGVAYS